MATFSYFQHYPHCLLDPLLLYTPNSSINLSRFEDQKPLYSPPNTSTIKDTSLNPFLDSYNVEKTKSSDVKKHDNTTTATTGSSSGDQLSQVPYTISTGKNRRRKTKNVSNFNEEVEGRKSKKQRNGKSSDIKEKRASEQDYIHVRARRGQATDSHSLAERVRREKISERMRILQNLVPGCDKVTGKALMLDEIINYVHLLQNQVEFLSMKLASTNLVAYDFDLDLDVDGLIYGNEDPVNNKPDDMRSTEVVTSFTSEIPIITPLFPSLLDYSIISTESHLQEDGEEREKLDRSGFNSNNFCSFY